MSRDEERTPTRPACCLAILCLAAIAGLCVLAVNFAGNWISP